MEDEQAVRAIFLKTKAELSKGWIQGNLVKKEGVCLFGALARGADLPVVKCDGSGEYAKGRYDGAASPGYVFVWSTPAGRAVRFMAETAGLPWQEMALWNDEEGRTVEEVVSLIDRCLARLREGPGRETSPETVPELVEVPELVGVV